MLVVRSRSTPNIFFFSDGQDKLVCGGSQLRMRALSWLVLLMYLAASQVEARRTGPVMGSMVRGTKWAIRGFQAEPLPQSSNTTGPTPAPVNYCTNLLDPVDLNLTGSKDMCEFVTNECTEDGILKYLQFRYCAMQNQVVLGFLLLFIWALYVMTLLTTTADWFFVPPLQYFNEKLNLTPEVAGVTVLALGNGGPDVFGAMAGIGNGNFALGLAGIMGASTCIVTMLLGIIVLIAKPEYGGASVNKGPFLRDGICYIVVTSLLFVVCSDKQIHLWEAIMMMLIYAAFVILVVCMGRHTADEDGGLADNLQDPTDDDLPRAHHSRSFDSLLDADHERKKDADGHLEGIVLEHDKGPVGKTIWAIQLPWTVFRHCTIPNSDGHWDWKRRYLLPISMPGFGVMFLLDAFPDDMTAAVVGSVAGALFVCGLLMFLATSNEARPAFYPVLPVVGFVAAVVWMDLVSGEIVGLLQDIGLLSGLSDTILGLTVLALGNCMADLAANVAVARAGSPKMALSTCFGSPFLNQILGLGAALTLQTAKLYPEPFKFDFTWENRIPFMMAIGAVCITLPTFHLSNYTAPRAFAVVLIGMYIAFVTVAFMLEFSVIPGKGK